MSKQENYVETVTLEESEDLVHKTQIIKEITLETSQLLTTQGDIVQSIVSDIKETSEIIPTANTSLEKACKLKSKFGIVKFGIFGAGAGIVTGSLFGGIATTPLIIGTFLGMGGDILVKKVQKLLLMF